jgi:hypothetical protein
MIKMKRNAKLVSFIFEHEVLLDHVALLDPLVLPVVKEMILS